MGHTEYIAALDLGSSKMIAMIGKKNEQGIISMIASEQTETEECIRRGYVHNVDKTSEKVKNLIKKLNANANVGSAVEKIYIGVGGQSLRSKVHSVSLDVDGVFVDEKMLKALYDECAEYKPESDEVLVDIVSAEYFLDGRKESNPVGVTCFRIEAKFLLIVGRPFKIALQKSIEEKAGLAVADYIPSPIATATAVLTENEKEIGCALIELGAGVTTLSIYKDKLLTFLVTIPLGGKIITKDICSLNLSEKDAEKLKLDFGSALIEFDDDKIKRQTAQLAEEFEKGNAPKIDLNELNNIIEARMDEILENVIHQIKASGYAEKLGAGVIITGGGAAMKNIVTSIQNKTNLNVRLAAVKKTLVNQSPDWAMDYANAEIVGLLAMGTENCARAITPTVEADGQTTILLGDVEETTNRKDPNSSTHPKNNGDDDGNTTRKNKGGLFGSLRKKFDNVGKSLFDDQNDGENEENEDNYPKSN